MIKKSFFTINMRNARLLTEVNAGIISYLTTVFIVTINPLILSRAHIPPQDVFLATCITIGFACILIGLRTNMPILIGPTSAINSYFVTGVTGNLGLNWQQGLGVVCLSGIIVLTLSQCNIRKILHTNIPLYLTQATAYGIGIFLIWIACAFSGIYTWEKQQIIWHWQPLSYFLLAAGVSLLAQTFKVPAHFIIGLGIATVAAMYVNPPHIDTAIALPHTFTQSFMALTFPAHFSMRVCAAIFAITVVVLFDCNASLNMLLRNSPRETIDCSRPIEAMGLSTIIGSILGTSSTGTYLESLSGIHSGGKTGVTACVAGVLFLITMFFSPLLHIIPPSASAALLFLIGWNISTKPHFVTKLPWPEKLIALLVIIIIPLRLSIADGIGIGIIAHTIVGHIQPKALKTTRIQYILATIFCMFFAVKLVLHL